GGGRLAGIVVSPRGQEGGAPPGPAAGWGLPSPGGWGSGFYSPPMHTAGKADPVWASLIFRIVSTAVVLAAATIRRPPLRLGGWKLVVILAVGLGDTLGNFLFAAAASQGGLESLTSVLASLYPIVTVLLAAFVLHGRVARVQRAGAALALAGIVLIGV